MKTKLYKYWNTACRFVVPQPVFVGDTDRLMVASWHALKIVNAICTFNFSGRIFSMGKTLGGDYGVVIYGTGLGCEDKNVADHLFAKQEDAQKYMDVLEARYTADPVWTRIQQTKE